jgi:glycosyltransferase involved in cell wall biosynthesis
VTEPGTRPQLRIGVDARELLGDATGVGRYLGELLRRWTSRADAAARRFVLYAPERPTLPLSPGAADVRVGGGGRGTWWEQAWLGPALRREPPDVFFAPAYTAPLGMPAPLAVTIHDISFVAHPEWFRPREGLRRRFLTRHAAAASRVILTDSQFSRREIEMHLSVPASKIRVIPPGLTPRGPSAPAGPRQALVLFVGSIFNRRRLPDLVAAFARVVRARPDARLVIVGDDRTWPPQDLRVVAESHGVAGHTTLLAYAPDEELARLYGEASVFAFLSEYEGFGLTPLEALAAGVPPVVLDTEIAREVNGDAAVYVPPDDTRAAADAILRLLTSPDARAAVLAHAPAVLARYSWDRAAGDTLAAIEAIGRGPAPGEAG